MIDIGMGVTLTEVMMQYMQPQDDCNDGLDQVLTVRVVDGGAGPYLVLETVRWAAEDVEAFAAGLREVLALVERTAEAKEEAP